MIIVVDGYNVLKQRLFAREITQKERTTFIAQLTKYARIKKHKILLVFDGGPYEWMHKERIGGIHVVYSGAGETADDYIKHYLEMHKDKDLLLVSSDHELNVWASRLDIPSIGAQDFEQLVQEGVRIKQEEVTLRGGKATKLREGESEELDALMEQATQEVPLKSEDVVRKKVEPSDRARKASKKDRKLLKKLKKM